jgi:hypothetical protein
MVHPKEIAGEAVDEQELSRLIADSEQNLARFQGQPEPRQVVCEAPRPCTRSASG